MKENINKKEYKLFINGWKGIKDRSEVDLASTRSYWTWHLMSQGQVQYRIHERLSRVAQDLAELQLIQPRHTSSDRFSFFLSLFLCFFPFKKKWKLKFIKGNGKKQIQWEKIQNNGIGTAFKPGSPKITDRIFTNCLMEKVMSYTSYFHVTHHDTV